MEEEAAAAILQVLVQNLIDHSKKEISLIRGLNKDATGNLDTIQKFLTDAETSSIRGEDVKSWLKKLEDAAFDADNVLDEVDENQDHQVDTAKILKLSFGYLSSPSLKKCFAYCSMFPKGQKISKQEVIEYWMAEGFLEDDMESAGEEFISVLLRNECTILCTTSPLLFRVVPTMQMAAVEFDTCFTMANLLFQSK